MTKDQNTEFRSQGITVFQHPDKYETLYGGSVFSVECTKLGCNQIVMISHSGRKSPLVYW